MKPVLIVHPDAAGEYEAERRWYFTRDAGTGLRFVDRVEEAFRALSAHPRRYPRWKGRAGIEGVRRLLVSGFPFVIPYLPQEDAVLVLAVAHLRRRPGYWQSRIPA